MIHEFINPIPAVIIETKQDCLIWTLWSTGIWANDVYTVVLLEGGGILHVNSQQITISANATFGIKKK